MGVHLLRMIRRKTCTVEFLEELNSQQCPEELRQPIQDSTEVQEMIKEAVDYKRYRKARAEEWTKKSKLRLVALGGRTYQNEQQQRTNCFIAYDEMVFTRFMNTPDNLERRTMTICRIPQGFFITDGCGRRCYIYDSMKKHYQQVAPVPTIRRR